MYVFEQLYCFRCIEIHCNFTSGLPLSQLFFISFCVLPIHLFFPFASSYTFSHLSWLVLLAFISYNDLDISVSRCFRFGLCQSRLLNICVAPVVLGKMRMFLLCATKSFACGWGLFVLPVISPANGQAVDAWLAGYFLIVCC